MTTPEETETTTSTEALKEITETEQPAEEPSLRVVGLDAPQMIVLNEDQLTLGPTVENPSD